MTSPEGSGRATVTARQGALVTMMRAAGRVEQALDDVCGTHGLTHDQYNVLRVLRGARPAGLPRYAIADRMLSRAPDVTRILGRLEKNGLIERYRSPADKRLSMARATARGLRLLDTIDPEVQALHESLAGGMSEADARSLSALCGRLLPDATP